MTLAPIFQAGPVVIAHALAAGIAVALGLLQFARPKGDRPHRLIGWGWVALMALVTLSSFGIRDLRQSGSFSWIHAISLMTIAFLVVGVAHARAGRIEAHRWTMIGLFLGALVITGLFTLMPGRVMHAVVFG